MRRLQDLVEAARQKGPATVAIAAAHDPDVVEAMKTAEEIGLAKGIFVGNKAKISALAEQVSWKIPDDQLVDEREESLALRKAIGLVRDKTASLLMKGSSSSKR